MAAWSGSGGLKRMKEAISQAFSLLLPSGLSLLASVVDPKTAETVTRVARPTAVTVVGRQQRFPFCFLPTTEAQADAETSSF